MLSLESWNDASSKRLICAHVSFKVRNSGHINRVSEVARRDRQEKRSRRIALSKIAICRLQEPHGSTLEVCSALFRVMGNAVADPVCVIKQVGLGAEYSVVVLGEKEVCRPPNPARIRNFQVML